MLGMTTMIHDCSYGEGCVLIQPICLSLLLFLTFLKPSQSFHALKQLHWSRHVKTTVCDIIQGSVFGFLFFWKEKLHAVGYWLQRDANSLSLPTQLLNQHVLADGRLQSSHCWAALEAGLYPRLPSSPISELS